MNKLLSGTIAGLVFGILDVLLMIPLPIGNKSTAMLGSFINRFAIGFLIANTNIPVSPWIKGLLIGLLLSLPDAIITKTYAPNFRSRDNRWHHNWFCSWKINKSSRFWAAKTRKGLTLFKIV